MSGRTSMRNAGLLLIFLGLGRSQEPYFGYEGTASNNRRDASLSVLLSPSPPGYYKSDNVDKSLKRCKRGYYCPAGTSSVGEMLDCGTDEFFCPEGSSRPTRVDVGYYTLGPSTRKYAEKVRQSDRQRERDSRGGKRFSFLC